MKKFTLMLIALCTMLVGYAAGPQKSKMVLKPATMLPGASHSFLKKAKAAEAALAEATFNFNEMDVATSNNASQDGDINEALTLSAGKALLTVSPKDEGVSNANRFWSTKNGPQLRVYSGTLTFTTKDESPIKSIDFRNNAKWNDGNSADCGELNDTVWTGDATTVVITIAGNSQFNSIVVSYEKSGDEPTLESVAYGFEDGTMQGWTTIDADGDGYDWALSPSGVGAHNGSNFAVYSESYKSGVGALTPNNFLVSPKVKLDGSITFYACAQDNNYPAEHFGVFVSTAGNTSAEDFTMVKEWTMTAAPAHNQASTNGMFRSPNKVQGSWYKYTVDLSSFDGADGYVAICHFNCSDFFYLVVDDITIETSSVEKPDYTITPAEGKVKSLSKFILTFNNYEFSNAEAVCTLSNATTGTVQTGNSTANGDTLTIEFEETTEPGEYTLTIAGLKNTTANETIDDLTFNYSIAGVVVLPETAEVQTWYFSAKASESTISGQEIAVAIDGNDLYIQGFCEYLPEAWVKGTIDAEAGTVTFPSGQYFGAFEYDGAIYDMYFVGYDNGGLADVVFTIDEEAGTMTSDQFILINSSSDQIGYYEYYSSVVLTAEQPEPVEPVVLPEGAVVNNWYFVAYDSEETFVRKEVGVAFVDNDIYVQGICDYLPEAWVKGTIDGETATFANGQFYGTFNNQYDLFFVGYSAAGVGDVVFTYDAEQGILTTDNYIVLANDANMSQTYDYYTAVEITRDRPDAFPVEAPENLETETYLFTAMEIVEADDEEDETVVTEGEINDADETEDTYEEIIDFNDMEVATSSSESTDGDITEALTLTGENVTLTISPKEEGKTTENRFWSTDKGPQLRVYSGTLTFSVPEGCTMKQIVFNAAKWNEGNSADSGVFDGTTWTGDTTTVVISIAGNTQINSIEVTVAGEAEEIEISMEPYSYQMQVGFDGNDVYFKGFTENIADMWAKGTLSEDGKTVTIPANQYLGQLDFYGIYTFDYYLTAVGDDMETMEDIVFTYDAETNTFATDQLIVLHDGQFELGEPYQVFAAVEITKMNEFAATPADPSVADFAGTGNYPKVDFVILAEDVEGNALMEDKLFYTIWIEKDGAEQKLTLLATDYEELEEDLTEIPYTFTDNWDIYAGGSRIYLNQGAEEIQSWTKIGIQSIYYGADECHKSNIVWFDLTDYWNAVGIKDINIAGQKAVIFDLQGRRVAQPAKGLYIVNGKKVVLK